MSQVSDTDALIKRLSAEIERLCKEVLTLRVAAQTVCQAFDDGSDMQSSIDRLERALDGYEE